MPNISIESEIRTEKKRRSEFYYIEKLTETMKVFIQKNPVR